MKAALYTEYGPPSVLKITEIDKPEPKANEILVKVHATTATAGDWRMRKADPFVARLFNGLLRPKRVKILGFEIAGTVEAIGSGVTRFKSRDEVFAFLGFAFGGYAEYAVVPTDSESVNKGFVEIKPSNISFQEAAAVPVGALTALGFLRKANIRAGRKVLVYGASGSVGTYAVQIAKYHEAVVTGVCSGSNLDLVKSLGADRVIDYTKGDFTEVEVKYDIIFDAVGKMPGKLRKKSLATGGRFVSVNGSAKLYAADMRTLKELIEAAKMKPVIDRRYRLDEIVQAHAYVEQGHKKGNVVIEV